MTNKDIGRTSHGNKGTTPKTHSRKVIQSITFLGVLVGLGFIISPFFFAWWNAKNQVDVATYYSQQVNAKDYSSMRADAQAYNESLKQMSLDDPYQGKDPAHDDQYWNALSVEESDAIGVIVLPGATTLPIYHGSAKETLDRGVGHLYGSSLPIGGAGTHAVLSAHSGVPGNRLFDPVHDMTVRDRFAVQVPGDTMYYQVDKIQIVTPEKAENLLQIEPGKDQITLVTCYPYGVNSHRLLVTGQRIPNPDADAQIPAMDPTVLLWPWVLPVVVIGAVVVAWLFYRRTR